MSGMELLPSCCVDSIREASVLAEPFSSLRHPAPDGVCSLSIQGWTHERSMFLSAPCGCFLSSCLKVCIFPGALFWRVIWRVLTLCKSRTFSLPRFCFSVLRVHLCAIFAACAGNGESKGSSSDSSLHALREAAGQLQRRLSWVFSDSQESPNGVFRLEESRFLFGYVRSRFGLS